MDRMMLFFPFQQKSTLVVLSRALAQTDSCDVRGEERKDVASLHDLIGLLLLHVTTFSGDHSIPLQSLGAARLAPFLFLLTSLFPSRTCIGGTGETAQTDYNTWIARYVCTSVCIVL